MPEATGIGVGIQYFGLPDACDVSAYTTPPVPIERLPAVGSALVDSTGEAPTTTLTPTAPALEGALQYMQGFAATNPGRASVVLMVTDGLPTQCGVSCASSADCFDEAAGCVNAMCDPTSIDAVADLAARYAAEDPPVLTFVLALGDGLSSLVRVIDETACVANNGEGWWYDDNASPTRMLLCPQTCQHTARGVLSVRPGCRSSTAFD